MKWHLTLWNCALLLVMSSCKTSSSNPESATDSTAPSISITVPANNTTVTDSVSVTVEANDNVGVEKVEFYVDGSLAYTRAVAPWQYNWVVLQLIDKSTHTLIAKAYDAANNIGSSQLVTVQVTKTAPPINLSDYGEYLDSLYIKVWSDSTWEEFQGFTTIGGTLYSILLNSTGNSYYYTSVGYAGWKPKGQSLILFDSPRPALRSQWRIGDTQTTSTTFTYQGYFYTMSTGYMLLDTSSVSVPIGIFSGCTHFSSTMTLSTAGQSSTSTSDFWMARGPGTIRSKDQQGVTIVMVRGYVNGKDWRTVNKKASPGSTGGGLLARTGLVSRSMLLGIGRLGGSLVSRH